MTNRTTQNLSRLLIALPLLSLALGVMAWLRYGMDIPWFDDWRGYADDNIHSLAITHLFRQINDTMAPVGFALDALAQRYLDGNTVAYQFLSMTVVLGSLLWLQWKLLRMVLATTLQAAICFSFTVLMLQPGSYWGTENLAYHQCLPLVFILSAMVLIIRPQGVRGWQLAAIPLLGLVAGMTYISGAFGVLSAGLGLLLIALTCHAGEERRQMARAAGLLAAAGFLTVGIQISSFLHVFQDVGTHAGIPMAWPTEAPFWMFYLGKIGRSLLLAPSWPKLSLILAILACLTAGVMGLILFRRAVVAHATPLDRRVAGIYTGLSGVVFVYLLMVAAGRTNYRGPEINGMLDIFVHGFTRFHFFWAALIWPWVVAGFIILVGGKGWAQKKTVQWSGMVLVLLVAVGMAKRGAYDHMSYQHDLSATRLVVSHCLIKGLQRGGEVRCSGMVPPRMNDPVPDAYGAYLNAQRRGASFVRNFPASLYQGRPRELKPFYAMANNGGKLGFFDLEKSGEKVFRAAGRDPQLHLETHQPQRMRRCASLEVEVIMKANVKDKVQVFFKPTGLVDYNEQYSSERVLSAPGSVQTLSFRQESETGFEDALRFDPMSQRQAVEIDDIRVYCIREQK